MNEVLGSIPCDCGRNADVMQTKRAGKHLYSRCADCGLDQRTGAKVQTRLWLETEWRNGVKPPRPSNVSESATKPATETATEKPSSGGAFEDFEPDTLAAEKATNEATKNKPKGRFGVVAGGLLIITALGAAIWTA